MVKNYKIIPTPNTDYNKKTPVGIKLPLNDSSIFRSTYTTEDQIRANLINFFNTYSEEIYLNPNKGVSLKQFTFEPNSPQTSKQIKSYIEDQIQNNFPEVFIIDIITQSNNNNLNINIKYRIKNLGSEEEININV